MIDYKIDYKKELNSEQLNVVMDGDGPCLVLAGAGSGKTRTLIYRVAYLLEQGIDPENILLVTFTNKAAKEMLARVERLLGFQPEGLNGGTFHHIGNLILRKYAHLLDFQRNFGILDEEDSESIIKFVMNDLNVDTRGKSFPKSSIVKDIISFANNSHKSVLEIAQVNYGYPDFIAFKIDEIAAVYKEKKHKTNVMDFDDLLIKWLELLQKFPDTKEKLSKQYRYILVDEYQDTNYIQAQIVKELSVVNGNVLVVGDDSQSIFSFRAADVNNILSFPKIFPGAKVFRIETNYRSTPQILNLANESIRHNTCQYEKKLKAMRDDGLMPALIPARDVYQQSALVVNRIIELNDKGVDYSNIAVLFRATYLSVELQLDLAKKNIPYVVRGGQRYFEQAHIKDIISYLKILANIKDELAWRRILKLYDGIGQANSDLIWKTISKMNDLVEIINNEIKLSNSKAQMSWQKIVNLFKYLSEIKSEEKGFVAKVISLIMDFGYEDYLKLNFENYHDRIEDLDQFVNFVINYDSLDKLLADVMLSERFVTDNEQKENVVVLSTIHQSKGLEWKYVMVIGLRDGDFPHYKSLDDQNQLEEERRLFYVAVTRAKDELSMLYPVRKFSYQMGETTAGPSMFVRELDDSKYVLVGGQDFVEYNDYEEVIRYD